LPALDISHEAGGPQRALVKEFHDIRVRRDLTVTLTPDPACSSPVTILCGIEVIAEGW
jgi:hypothetical protein